MEFGGAGEWDALSFVAEILLAIAILLELYSLWRALSLEDDEANEYRKTLRWFIASVVVLFVSLLLAAEIAAEPRLHFLKGGTSMKEKALRTPPSPPEPRVEFTNGDQPGVRMRKGKP